MQIPKQKPSEVKFKQKPCRICRKKFQPVRSIQPVCDDFECKVAYATKAAEKSKVKREVRERKELKAAKDKLKGRDDYINELDRVFGAYVRYRDKDKPCICCSKHLSVGWVGGKYEAGHYISRRHYATRWDEENVNAQKKYCNRWLKGNHAGYRDGLIQRYGEATVIRLEALAKTEAHISTERIREMIVEYKQKLKELKMKNK